MPHLTLHYSRNIDIDVAASLNTVNTALARSGHFEEIDIKSRAFRADDFLVGVPAAGEAHGDAHGGAHGGAQGRAFVAATLSVLTGRSDEVRRDMGEIVLKALASCLPPASALHVQVSVEVVEIQRETYAKTVITPGQR